MRNRGSKSEPTDTIKSGARVVDANGQEIGVVITAYPSFLQVQVPDGTDRAVTRPDWIARVAADGTVFLTVTLRELSALAEMAAPKPHQKTS